MTYIVYNFSVSATLIFTNSTPEDVKAVAVPALAHRISIRPELWMTSVTGADVVREVLSGTPVPGARP